MNKHHRLDYVEFPATDLQKIKTFYNKVFGWKFEDYGTNYTSFHDGRLAGGFSSNTAVVRGGTLMVIYSEDLQTTYAKVIAAGGKIVKSTFEFPGGRRFHFTDPSGNELSVWSDK
ncbi:MAG: VOC family protein [Terriglobales bacterium]